MKKFNKEYIEYLNSPKWNFIRNQVARKNNYRCQLCNKQIFKGFHIHHLTYEHFGNEPLEDLMFLCPECHLSKIHKQYDNLNIKKEEKKKKKIKISDEEKEKFLEKNYFLNNFDKLNPEEKSQITSFLFRKKKGLLREYSKLRIKQKSYI